MPYREQNSNKGTFGKVLAFCGSDNYIGASYLACLSVLKIGAGLCALSTTDKVIDSVSKKTNRASCYKIRRSHKNSRLNKLFNNIR